MTSHPDSPSPSPLVAEAKLVSLFLGSIMYGAYLVSNDPESGEDEALEPPTKFKGYLQLGEGEEINLLCAP